MSGMEYSFWNGKNLNGKQEYVDVVGDADCSQCAFKCVVGSETVAGDDL